MPGSWRYRLGGIQFRTLGRALRHAFVDHPDDNSTEGDISNYQDTMGMSGAALIDQLTSDYGEKFTYEEAQLTVNQLADSFAVYPSLSGTITEAARRLVAHDDLE